MIEFCKKITFLVKKTKKIFETTKCQQNTNQLKFPAYSGLIPKT